MKIRNKLIALTTGVLAFGSTACTSLENKLQETQPTQILQNSQTAISQTDYQVLNFPKTLPNAQVRKFLVPNSNHYLVHVKNAHHLPDLSQRELNFIKKTQNGIYSFLPEVLEYMQTNEVFHEGVVEGEEQEENAWLGAEHLMRLCRKIDAEKNPKTKKEFEAYEEIYKNDGVRRLVIEGEDIQIKHAESRRLIPAASRAAERGDYLSQAISENREDYLVSISSKRPNTIIIFGAGHSFQDNIKNYNNQNPSQKLSLIEIWPDAFLKK